MNMIRVWIKDNDLVNGSEKVKKAVIDLWVRDGDTSMVNEILDNGVKFEMKGKDNKGIFRYIPAHQIISVYYYSVPIMKDDESKITEHCCQYMKVS